MTAPILIATDQLPYRSEIHAGREIAMLGHAGGWLVYVDCVMQQNRVFATKEDARAWLVRQIDGRGRSAGSRSRRKRPDPARHAVPA